MWARVLACVMSLVLAVGLVPAPAIAEAAAEAASTGGQLVAGAPADDSGAGEQPAIVLGGEDNGGDTNVAVPSVEKAGEQQGAGSSLVLPIVAVAAIAVAVVAAVVYRRRRGR